MCSTPRINTTCALWQTRWLAFLFEPNLSVGLRQGSLAVLWEQWAAALCPQPALGSAVLGAPSEQSGAQQAVLALAGTD